MHSTKEYRDEYNITFVYYLFSNFGANLLLTIIFQYPLGCNPLGKVDRSYFDLLIILNVLNVFYLSTYFQNFGQERS